MKALYPPGPETSVSVPDQTWDATMRFSAAPSTVVTAPPGVTGSWDMMVLSPPGDVRGAIIVTGPAGMDFQAPATPANSAVTVQYITPNASRLTKQYGIVDGNASSIPLPSYASPADVAAFRTVGRAVTVHCTASDLYNGGTVTAGQFCAPPKPTSILASSEGEHSLATGVGAVFSRTLFDIGLDENAIIQMCPGAQTTEAKHGCFMPLRLLGPTQPFVRPAVASDHHLTVQDVGGSPYLWTVAEVYEIAGSPAVSDRTIPAGFSVVNVVPGSATNDDAQPWWVIASMDAINADPIYDTPMTFVPLAFRFGVVSTIRRLSPCKRTSPSRASLM